MNRRHFRLRRSGWLGLVAIAVSALAGAVLISQRAHPGGPSGGSPTAADGPPALVEAARELARTDVIERYTEVAPSGTTYEVMSAPGIGSRIQRTEVGEGGTARTVIEHIDTCSIFSPKDINPCWTMGQSVANAVMNGPTPVRDSVGGRAVVRLELTDRIGKRHLVYCDPVSLHPIQTTDVVEKYTAQVSQYELLPRTASNLALLEK